MSSSPKQKLLIVDDDDDVLSGIRCRLTAAGFETCVARDGAEGIETALRECPDAILLDVRMPRLDGLCALKILRSQAETRHIPVVMLSASLPDSQLALDSGARYFLRKPYRASTLMAAVRAVVPNSKTITNTSEAV